MPQPGSGLTLDPAQLSLTPNQRVVFNRLRAQGTPDNVARMVAISVAKAEGLTPPAGVQAACKRGLELAPEHGGAGLTEGAKARARSMAAGNAVSPDQIRRMHSFFSRHDSYPKEGGSEPSPGYVSWQLWGGDAGKSWAASQSEKLEKSVRRQALAKSAAGARQAICRGDERQTGYHKAFTEAAKAILPQGVIDTLHKRARAIAGGQGKASSAAAARAEAGEMGELLEKAEWNESDHPRDDHGRFGDTSASAAHDRNTAAAENLRPASAHGHVDAARSAAKAGDEAMKRGEGKQALEHYSQAHANAKAAVAAAGEDSRSYRRVALGNRAADYRDTKAAESSHRVANVAQTDKGDRDAARAHGIAAMAHKQVREAYEAVGRIRGTSLRTIKAASDRPAMGAAFSHARASGKKQDHESRKRRANAWLKANGHKKIGEVSKAAPCVEDVRQEQFVDAEPKKKRKKDRVPVEMATRIVKAEDVGWKKLVWSVVYEPDVVDSHGDYMTAETIEKAAHGAMRNGIYINREHAGAPIGAHVVESYVAPCEMVFDQGGEQVTVAKGSWVMGMQIESNEVWADVLDGTFTGFSLEGSAAAPQAI